MAAFKGELIKVELKGRFAFILHVMFLYTFYYITFCYIAFCYITFYIAAITAYYCLLWHTTA